MAIEKKEKEKVDGMTHEHYYINLYVSYTHEMSFWSNIEHNYSVYM